MTESEQIQAINDSLRSQYNSIKYGELKALSKIFCVRYLVELENILNRTAQSKTNYKDSFEVSCGWIDKIPMAEFVSPVEDINGNSIKERMELGDLLIVYSHNHINLTSKFLQISSIDNRALIVQAKIANKAFPKVPIVRMSKKRVSPTSKELTLLNSWPKFNLFQTSKSLMPLLVNIKLDPTKSNAKFAGYFFKQWYIGNPINNSVCNESFGSLILNLKKGAAGQDFDVNGSSDWDKLIKTLVDTCGKYKLPNFIFSGSLWKRYFSIPRKPIILYYYFGINIFVRKKFPILVINRIVQEGKL